MAGQGNDRPRDQDQAFSLIVQPSTLGNAEVRYVLSMDAAERDALARRFDLVEIGRFEAALRLKWLRGGRILRLRGTFAADVTQTCVVTLEPFESTVEETFENFYRPALAGASAEAGDAVPDREGEDDFSAGSDGDTEPFYADSLDIAEMAARELSLALDPYPRKPGARPGNSDQSGDEENLPVREKSPFEVLAVLKGKK